MSVLLVLMQAMAIFLVIAYVYSKLPAFRVLTAESLRPGDKLFLYLAFSGICILGTYLGVPVQGAIANTRAMGAVLAGLIGGPWIGGAVGLTGGLHRLSLGGFTAFSCALSTTVAGVVGGLVHLHLTRAQQDDRVFSPWVALATAAAAEVLQMGIILVLARPFADAWALVEVIALPMISANAVGTALFMSVVRDQKNMYDRFGARFSGRAFRIAEQTLKVLAKGFDAETAGAVARILREETGVGAVAITDTEQVLAFVGTGSDHHRPGNRITGVQTREALRANEVVFMDGVAERFRCNLSRSCPLGSLLVVPLRVGREVVGTVELYEPRNRFFRRINRTFGEGIGSLLSNQLLLSRWEEQRRLLAETELKLLHAQVNPHFLFNALNTIGAVLRQDPQRAKGLLVSLSTFFRANLKRNRHVATLEEELEHMSSYLEIEKARFEDRLTVETEVDPSILPLRIPNFSLQPIVENAIKHGTSKVMGTGRVKISAIRQNGLVHIDVEDNAGLCTDLGQGKGLGIQIVDRRIKSLYGGQYGVAVECEADAWTRVRITVPAEGFRR